jgi:hypothetical protein
MLAFPTVVLGKSSIEVARYAAVMRLTGLNVTSRQMKYWEIIADNLKKAGWRCGCISSTNHEGRQFWVVAAEREDAGRFIVHTHELRTAFLELQAAIHGQLELG